MSDNTMPTGELQGDTKAMRDCGIYTGVTDTYGANLSGTNRIGGLGNSAKSDAMSETDASDTKMDGDE